MPLIQIILGVLGIILGFVGLVPYIRDIFLNKTKPHAFSWFVWGLIESIVFFAQITSGGGIGSMIAGVSAATSLFISIIAFLKKDVSIMKTDWLALGCALIGIGLWQTTSNPLLAIIAVTIADLCGFIPTFRKAYRKPQEETIIEYEMSAAKWLLSLLALGSFTLTTALYPISLVVTNGLFVAMVFHRSKKN